MKGIEAVTFDVGGTLITPWPSVGHVYAQGAMRLGLGEFSPEELSRRFSLAWKAKTSFDYSRRAWANLVGSTFSEFVPASAHETLFTHLYDAFRSREAWHLHEDVLPTLAALRAKRLRLGIISNWDDRLPPLLEAFELSRYFDASVISYELNQVKPAPPLFHLAAQRLGVKPEKILHIGDSEKEDVSGARAAGFQSILLDRKNPGADRITKLTDLLELLDEAV